MTSRERLMAVLTEEKPDRIPWSPLIDQYYLRSLPEQGYKFNLSEVFEFIKADLMERHVPIIKRRINNLEISETNNNLHKIITYRTPVGEISLIYTNTSTTSFVSKHPIENTEDIKVFKYMTENTEYLPDYQTFIEEDSLIGEKGIATADGPLTPIQELLQHLMGVQIFVYILTDFPEELEELMNLMHEKNKEAYKLIAESPAKVIIDYEDTSTTVMSPSFYTKYSQLQLEEYSSILHKEDKIFITHMCGKLKSFGPLIKSGSMDGIDSVCPPTTGDVWPWEAHKLFGNKKIIIGGIEPPALSRMSVEETKNYIIQVLKGIAPGDRFILSTGDATSYGTPIENLLVVTKIIEEYGKYPISI